MKDLEKIYHDEGLNPATTQDQVYTKPESQVRLSIVKAFLDQAIDSFDYKPRLLEVGCAEGLYLDYVKEKVEVAVGLDLSAPKFDRAYQAPNIVYVEGNVEHFPFPDKHFDIILASEILEHLQTSIVIGRDLIPKARRIIVTVPIYEKPGANPNHLQQFTPTTIKRVFEMWGGEVIEEHINEKPNFIAIDVKTPTTS